VGLLKEPSYDYVSTTQLLVPAMRAGKVVHREDIHQMRARCREQIAKLPDDVRRVERTDKHEKIYPVAPSEQVMKLLDTVKQREH